MPRFGRVLAGAREGQTDLPDQYLGRSSGLCCCVSGFLTWTITLDHYDVKRNWANMVDHMQINVSEAKGQLLDLVRRAEAGEEVVLTRHGEPVVRLIPARRKTTAASRREALLAARGAATSGVPAARSQDFLYDERGMPA